MSLLGLLSAGATPPPEEQLSTMRQVSAYTASWRDSQGPGSNPGDIRPVTLRWPLVVRTRATDLRVEFHCPYLPTGYKVKAALHHAGGIVPLTFGGVAGFRNVTYKGHEVSDVVPGVTLAPGDVAHLRMALAQITDDTPIPWTSWAGVGPTGFTSYAGDFVDVAETGANANKFPWSPVAVKGLAVPSAKALAILGDSISEGGYDSTAGGFQTRAANAAGWAYSNLSCWAQSMSQVYTGNAFSVDFLGQTPSDGLASFTHAVTAYGANDIPSVNNFETMKTQYRAWWAVVAASGVKLAQTTVLPRTTSTDDHVTLANQTPISSEPVRAQINAWLRDGAPTTDNVRAGEPGHPLKAIIDTAATVQAPGDPSRWRVDPKTVSDGAHPEAAGHALMSVPVKAWLDAQV